LVEVAENGVKPEVASLGSVPPPPAVCADEGGICTCTGQVVFGRKYEDDTKTDHVTIFPDVYIQESTSQLLCAPATFRYHDENGDFPSEVAGQDNSGDPAKGQEKHCICIKH